MATKSRGPRAGSALVGDLPRRVVESDLGTVVVGDLDVGAGLTEGGTGRDRPRLRERAVRWDTADGPAVVFEVSGAVGPLGRQRHLKVRCRLDGDGLCVA